MDEFQEQLDKQRAVINDVLGVTPSAIWNTDLLYSDDMAYNLYKMGYKVMLWVCPFVSMDSPGYREMVFGMLDAGRRCEKGGLIMTGGKNQYGRQADCVVEWLQRQCRFHPSARHGVVRA